MVTRTRLNIALYVLCLSCLLKNSLLHLLVSTQFNDIFSASSLPKQKNNFICFSSDSSQLSAYTDRYKCVGDLVKRLIPLAHTTKGTFYLPVNIC